MVDSVRAFLWGSVKRKIVTSVLAVSVLVALVTPSSDSDGGTAEAADTSTSSSTTSEVLLPERREGSTDDRPFWMTTFAVRLPAGAWEEVDGDCRAVSDAVRLLTAEGVDVGAFDMAPTVTLSLGNEIDGDWCLVSGTVLGDYADDISSSYVLRIGDLEAVFSNVELYQGQGAGENAVVEAG